MEDNNKHPIDELFRKKLNEEQLVPDESLWNEVEVLLDKKKKRRFFILPFSFLILALGISGYYVYTMGNKMPGISSSKTLTAKNSTGNNGVPVSSNGPGTNKVTAGLGSVSNISINQDENTKTQQLSQTSNNIVSNSATSVNSAGKLSAASANAVKNERRKKGHNKTSLSTGSTAAVNGADNNLAPANNIAGSNMGVNTNEKNDSNESKKLTSSDVAPVSEGIKEDKTISGDSSVNPAIVKTDENKKIVLPHPHNSDLYWFIQANGDYISNSHFINTPSSVDPYYERKRTSNEKTLSTMNYSLIGGFKRRNLIVNTGISITKFGENVQYDTTKEVSQGDSITKHNGPKINTYVTVPVMVSYSFHLKAVSLIFGGGASTSIPLSWNSYYLNKNVDNVENPGDLKMLRNFVFSFNASVGLDIPITRNFDIILSADYRRNLTNIFKRAYDVNQEYLGVGGGVGIKYTFGRR